MKKLFILLFFVPALAFAQGKPVTGTTTIKVKNIGFLEMCNALLDAGYVIVKKDNDLGTAQTEKKQYPGKWSAQYTVSIRVKDSVATINGTSYSSLLGEYPATYQVNKKGKEMSSILCVPFLEIKRFAEGLKRELEYPK